jgi:hypothetical protein
MINTDLRRRDEIVFVCGFSLVLQVVVALTANTGRMRRRSRSRSTYFCLNGDGTWLHMPVVAMARRAHVSPLFLRSENIPVWLYFFYVF